MPKSQKYWEAQKLFHLFSDDTYVKGSPFPDRIKQNRLLSLLTISICILIYLFLKALESVQHFKDGITLNLYMKELPLKYISLSLSLIKNEHHFHVMQVLGRRFKYIFKVGTAYIFKCQTSSYSW